MEGVSLAGLRRFFYLVTPNETTFPTPEQVPKYLDLAVPWFMAFVIGEFLLGLAGVEERDGGKLYSLPDAVTSIAAGLLQSTTRTVLRGFEMALYLWVYDNCRLVDLSWESPWTWAAAFVAVDFGYYWFHRVAHESLLGWCYHAMHHSSNFYNYSTALRQGFVQGHFSMFFYLPAALFIPPSALPPPPPPNGMERVEVHLSHAYLNVLFQFWIHTQVIGKLGPLEWVINTPSHHRVHHGRNPYCIDKNYGGTLIIWDRLFGTFQEELPNEKIAYGLVHPLRTYNQFWAQLFLFKYTLWDKPRRMGSWWTSLQAVWRGPGWDPVLSSPCPPIKYPIQRYDPDFPAWLHIYVVVHFFIPLIAFVSMAKMGGSWEAIGLAVFIAVSFHSFGALYDEREWGGWVELGRCWAAYVCVAVSGGAWASWAWLGLHSVFALSAALWTTLLLLPSSQTNTLKASDGKSD